MRTALALILTCLATGALAEPQCTLGELPDRRPGCTPGEARALTLDQICSTKWGKDERAVTQAMKEHVFAKYGVPKDVRHLPNGKPAFEIDHLISRELAGADTEANLWPENYVGPWNARQKDRTENRLHGEVCAGRRDIVDVQHSIAADWRAEFRRYFGEPK